MKTERKHLKLSKFYDNKIEETSGIDCVVFENVFYASPEIFQIFHRKFSIHVKLLLKFAFKGTKVLLTFRIQLTLLFFFPPWILAGKGFLTRHQKQRIGTSFIPNPGIGEHICQCNVIEFIFA